MKNQRSKVSKRKGKRWKHFLVNNVRVKENWLKNNFYDKPNLDFVFSWKESLTLFLIILSVSLNFQKEIFWINWLQSTFFNFLNALQSQLKIKPFKLLPFLPVLRWFPIWQCDDETLNTHQLPSNLSHLVHFRGLKAWVIKNHMPHLSRFSAYFTQGKMLNAFPLL